jgi:hypothetical protein
MRVSGGRTVVALVILPNAKNTLPGVIYATDSLDIVNDDLGGAPYYQPNSDYNALKKKFDRWYGRYFVVSSKTGEERMACLCYNIIGVADTEILVKNQQGDIIGNWYCRQDDLTKAGKLLYRELSSAYNGIGNIRILTFVDT